MCQKARSAHLHTYYHRLFFTGVVVESAVGQGNVGDSRTNGVKHIVEAAQWGKRKDGNEQTEDSSTLLEELKMYNRCTKAVLLYCMCHFETLKLILA